MKDEQIRTRIHQAVDYHAQSMQADPFLAQRIINQERTGEPAVKKRLSLGLVLAIVFILLAVTAVAVTVSLLTPKEVVEQVAVPMAQENDKAWRIEMDFSPEELAAFIRKCNENGIDLDENDDIMKAIRNGQGYNEEEAIMAVCRIAFGGNYGEWTIAERHWFQDVMVSIGWETVNHVALPGPDDLTEEEAKARLLAAIRAEFGEDLPLEDRTQYETSLNYSDEPGTGAVWTLTCHPRTEKAEAFFEAWLDKAGNVDEVRKVDYGRPQTLEDLGYVYTLTEEDAAHLAAEGIRSQTGRDVPLEDPEKYHYFAFRTTDPAGWDVSFISHTGDWGRCTATVNDSTREVTVTGADVEEITADNILARYRSQYGWYDKWDTTVWAEIAAKAADLPASAMEGRIVKATPWIAWREGLLTRDEAEEKAFRLAGVRLGDVNCACIIDAEPNPVWKFRILPWDESYQDSIVVEIDAATGEMTDLDMYKSDYSELEPSFHMITLHRIWARLELEENGPLYLARMAVLKKFADLSFDMPEVDSIPIFDLRYWQPETSGSVVRFRSQWQDLPDYEVELDENGVPVRTEELPSGSTEPMPEALNRESINESLYDINPYQLSAAQEAYGLNDYTWPLEVQAEVFGRSGRTVPREGEMTLEEAVAFAKTQLPPETEEYVKNSTVGVLCTRPDAGLSTEKVLWVIYFMADPQTREGWRVTFLDAGDPDHEYSIVINEPGDNGNG